MKPKNYLNNKDILKEIHKSKISYCTYSDKMFTEYDAIITSLDEITGLLAVPAPYEKAYADGRIEIIQDAPLAKVMRADRLTKLAQDQALEASGKKVKAESVAVDPWSIADSEVVFRLKAWDHIPLAVIVPKIAKGKKKAAIELDDEAESLLSEYDSDLPEVEAPSPKYTKVNFPPFHHYILQNGTPQLVAMSHWVGDFETGHFSKDHGKATNTLAIMYMKLVERYATRSNWRGYTYNDEMRSTALMQLSQIGLQFDESKSDNPFAYYTSVITNSFTRVLNIEKRNQNIRDDILEINNLTPSYSRQSSGSTDYHGAGYEE